MGYSFLGWNGGLDVVFVERGIMQNACTSHVTAIQEFRHHVLPIVFFCLAIDNLEHTG